jgi:hypothetical protein
LEGRNRPLPEHRSIRFPDAYGAPASPPRSRVTTSPPAALSSATSSARRTNLILRNHRAADARIGCILSYPVAGLQIEVFARQQRCRGRIDAQHGKARIRVRRQRKQSLGEKPSARAN